MTTTPLASGTVAPRVARVQGAAAGIVLAYLGLLRDGEAARASSVLRAFQQFWSRNRTDIVAGEPGTGIPPDLVPSGTVDPETLNALAFTLWTLNFISTDGAQRRANETPAAHFQRLRGAVLPSVIDTANRGGSAYTAAYEVSAVDAGPNVLHWADNFVAGLDQSSEILTMLAEQNAGGDREGGQQGAIFVPGFSASGTPMPTWVWYVGGLALVMTGGLLAYRIKYERWPWRVKLRPRHR